MGEVGEFGNGSCGKYKFIILVKTYTEALGPKIIIWRI
jgi:hypothetical protein